MSADRCIFPQQIRSDEITTEQTILLVGRCDAMLSYAMPSNAMQCHAAAPQEQQQD
jgi:hypothetical protein